MTEIENERSWQALKLNTSDEFVCVCCIYKYVICDRLCFLFGFVSISVAMEIDLF